MLPYSCACACPHAPAGSFVSGLYTPRGDLDLSIEGTAIWCGASGLAGRGGGKRPVPNCRLGLAVCSVQPPAADGKGCQLAHLHRHLPRRMRSPCLAGYRQSEDSRTLRVDVHSMDREMQCRFLRVGSSDSLWPFFSVGLSPLVAMPAGGQPRAAAVPALCAGCHAVLLRSEDACPPLPRPRPQALASRIERGGLSRGRIERILHARVPILKFREATAGG